jgi:glyceraldehyde-3-phosphate dehydrogenase/erythrose-4-phosphate dehydrogenase
MTLKIGINGFGRIGRLVARIAIKHPELELVGVNDLVPADNLAYLFKYDSTHRTYPGTVVAEPDGISIDNRFISCLIKDPAELPWGKLGADYVVESTGLFTTYEGAQKHIQAGAKRKVVSMDFRTDPRSSIFDATAGIGLNANFFKVVAWYDNEWAYACRVIDLMLFMARKDGLI